MISAFNSRETLPISDSHRITRQMIQLAVAQCPYATYNITGSPERHRIPAVTARHITDMFVAVREERRIDLPKEPLLADATVFLDTGIRDSHLMFERASLPEDKEQRATILQHADTVYAAAFFAKHSEIPFNNIRGDEHAFDIVASGGIVPLSEEPVSLTGGCPEVSSQFNADRSTSVTPTRLFGQFVRWSAGLYLAADTYSTEYEEPIDSAHARKE